MSIQNYVKIRIQKGIPMPKVNPRGMAGTKHPVYPWHKMDVGDSFVFPGGRTAHTACVMASRKGKLFKACKIPEGYYRVWRVK